MSAHSRDNPPSEIAEKLRRAMATLLEAFDYALDTESDRWSFAIPVHTLHELGLNETDLRWFVRKGYVDHAREVTVPGDDGREFRSTGNLTFTRRTCFVLTDAGAAHARFLSGAASAEIRANEPQTFSGGNGHGIYASVGSRQAAPSPAIHWDPQARRLRVNGIIVKRFKWPAMNQELILTAFQEEGWPVRIDDPLPCVPEQDPKRRLSDTIKCLNRKQACRLIRFCGDGTGEGVIWELIESGANGYDAE